MLLAEGQILLCHDFYMWFILVHTNTQPCQILEPTVAQKSQKVCPPLLYEVCSDIDDSLTFPQLQNSMVFFTVSITTSQS